MDHVLPVALGGADEPSNLQTLCGDCNSGKAATPPDAATVDRVAEDAERWSQAIQAAADKMLADRDALSADHSRFDEWWTAWTAHHGRQFYRAPDWERSVSQFRAAGLPMEILKDCLDRAMSRKKVPARDMWKYFCGIAWSKVRDLQEAAKQALNADETTTYVAPDRDPRLLPGRASLAKDFLELFPPEEIEQLLDRARKSLRSERTPPSEELITIQAGFELVLGSLFALQELDAAAHRMLDLMPPEDLEAAMADVRQRPESQQLPQAIRDPRITVSLINLVIKRSRDFPDSTPADTHDSMELDDA